MRDPLRAITSARLTDSIDETFRIPRARLAVTKSESNTPSDGQFTCTAPRQATDERPLRATSSHL